MQRIGFIALPGFQVLSVGTLSVFEYANKEMDEPVYDVHLLSETGGSIRSSIGISIATDPFDDTNFDTLIVGGSAVIGSVTPSLIRFLRRALVRCRRRRDMHRRIHPGRGRSPRRPTRDHPLEPCT
jgi:transcriptional regulator GlxA family with amidase domain